MKKLCFVILGIIVVFMGIAIFDYQTNHRYFSADLHTVTVDTHQEQMEFSAPILRMNSGYLMSGAVRKIDNITVGATANVSCQGNTYEGTLCRLEPTFDGIYYASVSVDKINQEPKDTATAVILGNIRQNVMFVPEECVQKDSNGQDVVFVVQNGYAMKRNVKKGTLLREGQVEILQGLFPAETIIISPENIRTGDRILSP